MVEVIIEIHPNPLSVLTVNLSSFKISTRSLLDTRTVLFSVQNWIGVSHCDKRHMPNLIERMMGLCRRVLLNVMEESEKDLTLSVSHQVSLR